MRTFAVPIVGLTAALLVPPALAQCPTQPTFVRSADLVHHPESVAVHYARWEYAPPRPAVVYVPAPTVVCVPPPVVCTPAPVVCTPTPVVCTPAPVVYVPRYDYCAPRYTRDLSRFGNYGEFTYYQSGRRSGFSVSIGVPSRFGDAYDCRPIRYYRSRCW